jgi:cell division protein FtsW
MVSLFWQQAKKQEYMGQDRFKQGSSIGKGTKTARRGEKLKGYSPPLVRSPALKAAEDQERQERQERQAQILKGSRHAASRLRRTGETTTRRNANVGRVSYAAEGAEEKRGLPRKSLPRPIHRRGAVNVYARVEQRTHLSDNWPSNPPRSRTADLPGEPVQVISEEEQKKLSALEMDLPRVAGKIDSWLMMIVLALLCIGLIMVYSASSFLAAANYGDPSYFFQRQLLSALFGIIAMLITMRIDYRYWRRLSLIGMAIALPLLVLVLFIGTNVYGASRWIAIGSFTFQPSELTKLTLALYIADWLARKGRQVGSFLYGMAPFVILVGLILGLVLLQKDMGTAIIIAALATAMFFTAGANIVQFLLAMLCGGLIFLTQAFQGYRFYRLLGFTDPFNSNYTTNINLQLYQSLLALGSGGWLGVGLGASRQKTGYLPFPHIDSIFAVIGEELGFVGCVVIVMLFLFLAFRGFRLARRTQDMYGALLATGITTWLVLQAVINIAACTGSIPYTGVPLPFISYGGTALVISLAAVGVLLNISRYIQVPETPALSRRAITKTINITKENTERTRRESVHASR